MKNVQSNSRQLKRARRVSNLVRERSDLPVLIAKRSNQHLHAQIIDRSGKVLAAFSSTAIKDKKMTKTLIAKEVGVKLADLAKKSGVSAAVLNRKEYRFHGRIKALAESLNQNGIKV